MDDLPGERWQQIDAVFAAVLERSPAERDAFLERACGRDGELVREVRALLASELRRRQRWANQRPRLPAPCSLAQCRSANSMAKRPVRLALAWARTA